MPPRKGPRNVVKSGNAGNSSKSSPLPTTPTAPAGLKSLDTALGGEASRPPPLFPVGYKSPLTILNEKCQKEGWERPVVDLIPNKGTNPPTYSAAVTLRKRKNKNALDLETVRLVPVPGIEAGDAGMARHLGATYALFRFCSTLPMAMILPPSIRPYWSQLLSEKAQAPPHRAWEYSADPFAAKREVEKRQAVRVSGAKQRALAAGAGGAGAGGDGKSGKDGWDDGFAANARKQDNAAGGGGGRGGRGWNNVPEVKMSQNQREVVEGVIRSVSPVLRVDWLPGFLWNMEAEVKMLDAGGCVPDRMRIASWASIRHELDIHVHGKVAHLHVIAKIGV
ncbi:hypothetical protein QFC21_006078 [Naganishia friedmannii]|uniref:Uncharacterized protein n=1 Tax=Naganishia friedmannii TaxID=89922 RepID=A0ACC2V4S5_9TREE|nr:hypothetical protein QFC21_006078 [Naganishia friedmannii]